LLGAAILAMAWRPIRRLEDLEDRQAPAVA
jgi:hypothetical protein